MAGGSAAGLRGLKSRGHSHLSPPRHATILPGCPSVPGTYSPRCSHSSRRSSGQAGAQPGKASSPNPRKEKSQELQRTYLTEWGKRKPPKGGSSVPEGQACSHHRHRLFNSPFPRCHRPTRRGAGGRLANRVAPLSANQPIASRRRSKFE